MSSLKRQQTISQSQQKLKIDKPMNSTNSRSPTSAQRKGMNAMARRTIGATVISKMNNNKIDQDSRKHSSGRLDFLQTGRKPSSQAFPLMGGGDTNLSKEEVYDFENRLRDVIAELTKPIYDKISDTLTQQRTIKLSQDEVGRQTKELEFEIQQFAQMGNKLDDLRNRVDENAQNVQQIYVGNQRKINVVQEDFNTLKVDFRREEEYSRVARRAATSLQEEYCRIVHSVATEKQRNMMFIERAKRAFEQEITAMNIKVGSIDHLKKAIDVINRNADKRDKDMMLETQTLLLKQKIEFDRKLEGIQIQVGKLEKGAEMARHQQEMQGREAVRIEKEVMQTDFYLNKVQPIAHFTQFVSMLRNIVIEEEQLERLNELQNQFFIDMRNDTEAIKEHVDGRKSNVLDKFSPHYDKIVKALNEVDQLKNLAPKDVEPILIIGEEIERFEGLLKKVQNHREIVNTFEDKIEQYETSESGSSVQELKSKQPDQPTFVYVKGKKQTLIDGVPAISEHRTDHGSFLGKAKNEGGNRRSQSELQNVIQTDSNGVKQTFQRKTVMSLDLVQVLGKDQNASHSMQRKNRFESFSDPNGALEQGKSPANLQLSNKMRQGDTTIGYEEDDIIPSQLNNTQIKNLKQFEMTKEKYEASELVMNAFQRQFTIKDTIVDKLSAFKRGLTIGVKSKRVRRKTLDDVPEKDTVKNLGDIGGRKTAAHPPQINFSNKIKGGETVLKPKISIKKLQNKPTIEEEPEITVALSRDTILAKFIDEQKKLNEFHNTLSRFIIQDKAQQYEDDDSEFTSSMNSSKSSSEDKDELEALDSVKIDDNIGAGSDHFQQIQPAQKSNSGSKDVTTLNIKNLAEMSSTVKSDVEETPKAWKDSERTGTKKTQSIMDSVTNQSKSKSGSRSRQTRSRESKSIQARLASKTGSRLIKRQGSGTTKHRGMTSARSSNGGMSRRIGSRSKRGGVSEKVLLIMRKDLEKQMKKMFNEATKALSEEQNAQVYDMIGFKHDTLKEIVDKNHEELTTKHTEFSTYLDDEFKKMTSLQNTVSELSEEFKRVMHQFHEQQDRYDVCLKKMIKDKRATVQMHDNMERKVEHINAVIEVVHHFITEVADRVNHLLTAEDIDIRLYAQDEADRQQTVLYGINEEAGKQEMQANSPIHVNNNCLQCSGNASFIKKAFKLACLTYSSSKVQYQNEPHTREDLLYKRQRMVETTTKLSVEQLNQAIKQEGFLRLNTSKQQQSSSRAELSQHLRNSYNAGSALNIVTENQTESLTTFNNNLHEMPKMTSLQDIHESTNKLNEESKGNRNQTVEERKGLQKADTQAINSPKTQKEIEILDIGVTEFGEKKNSAVTARMNKRGTSASISKTKKTTFEHSDLASTLPLVTSNKHQFNQRKTTVESGKSSIDNYAMRADPKLQQQPIFFGKSKAKTQIMKDDLAVSGATQDKSSVGQSTRLSGVREGQVQQNGGGILSGRIPETLGTLDASDITGRNITQRYQGSGQKTMVNSPISNDIKSRKAPFNTLTTAPLSVGESLTAKKHTRRRTINTFSMNSTTQPKKMK